jgi:UDP-N-acetylmuramoyl-L-alanyl-D-glutamate--2,6-diaminopimelate ligase
MIRQLKNTAHMFVAVLANIFYGFPSKKIKVIGVTGTDGKTTTTSLIYHILKNAGKKASMVSTVYAKVGEKEYDTGVHVSTPNSFTVQKFLQDSVNNGDEYFVLETTSHGLDQNRVYGVQYAVGVITNITHEHLDYHKTYDNYLEAKAKLLQSAKIRVVNYDDVSYKKLSQILTENVHSYGLKGGEFSFDITKKINRELPEFNKYNFLAAYTTSHLLGISDEKIFEALKTFKSPVGRMEVMQEKPFTVVIDYAHTPNGTKEALTAMHTLYLKGKGRLIHVTGAEGRRDADKRAMIGEESGKQADFVVITEVDYRDTDPNLIATQVASGLQKSGFKEVKPELFGSTEKSYTILHDRKEALDKAISIAKPGDVVILTGKGHEKTLDRNNVEYPWDEQATVKELLQKYSK